jgi:uncharacterized protein (TIGR02466 family)
MTIDAWFPTLVYHTTLDKTIDNIMLKDSAYILKNKVEGLKSEWRCDTFNTLDYDHSIDQVHDCELTNLINIVTANVAEFVKEFGVEEGSLICSNYWFNISKPGNYQEYHQHADSHFSAVYYVQADPTSGNIVFKSFESMFDMYPIPTNLKVPANFKTCFYTPANSKLIIFRSNLLHMVEKNLSTKDRIGISMNFRIN